MTSYPKMATVQKKAICVLWFFETKSVIKLQRSYRKQYGKDPPSDNAIRRWLKQFQEISSVVHRKGAERPSASQEGVDLIQEVSSRSSQKSIKRPPLRLGISQTSVWRVFHNRLQSADPDSNLESPCILNERLSKIDSVFQLKEKREEYVH
jgi:hypothetical protein